MRRRGALALLLCAAAGIAFVGTVARCQPPRPPRSADTHAAIPQPLDPRGWGADHVGQPWPDYMTGDECLFCHRQIGSHWSENPHQRTLRSAESDASSGALRALREGIPSGLRAEQVELLLGDRQAVRLLRRAAEYGKLELHDLLYDPQTHSLRPSAAARTVEDSSWDESRFAAACAGCHTTAVEAATGAFSAISIDCVACHGLVPLGHSQDTRRVLLSPSNRDPRVVVSICGQCHLRGGTSRSTGRPYPNTFVAGDNLLRDFQVDLGDERLGDLAPWDGHVLENARAVLLQGLDELTCLSCHDVHTPATDKHRQWQRSKICWTCHTESDGPIQLSASFHEANQHRRHSTVCDY